LVTVDHPVDSLGLMLPEPSWPDEPGSAGRLEPLRRFCNTTNRENGAEAWRTPGELAAWLDAEDHRAVGRVTTADLTRLVAVREALWHGITSGDFDPFAAAVGELAVRLTGTAIVPARDGPDAVVAELALAVAATDASGELARLKSCAHCRWVFYDTSKNRVGRWCSMAACGGRDKARQYRRRQAAARR
jgi:predicted RNA-binding Zn ribbon-like protein